MNQRRVITSSIDRSDGSPTDNSYESKVSAHLKSAQPPPLDVKGTDPQIARAATVSIQDRATAPGEESGWGANIFSGLVRAGELISPWWSVRRDSELRDFWKTSNHLAGAVYAMRSKISTINFKVIPKDASVQSQSRAALERQQVIMETPEYGKGWLEFVSKWVGDLIAADNGAFAEIIGPGSPTGPIIGAPISFANLDSARCSRTSNPIYPVIYQDTDGKRYKLHYTRVMFSSQMPSPNVDMNGVGFCAVSRAIDAAQVLIDMTRFNQEKMGSRPPRIMLIGKKGISAEEIFTAFANAEEMDDNLGLSRFRRMVAIAPKQGRGEIDLDTIDLASVPDGFNEQQSTTLGMFVIALAFGMDAREIWPATASGATKADAMLSHMKARGKGPGQIMQTIERQLNQKFLPDTLTFQFDFQDDEQDAMQAEIRDKRSQRHERDVGGGIITVRVSREQMLSDGDLTPPQFESMELIDGRLPSGDSVLSLFFSPDKDIRGLLALDMKNPLKIDKVGMLNSDRQFSALIQIDAAILKVQEAIAVEGWSTQKQKARQALAALEYLRELWEPELEEVEKPMLSGRPRENTAADTERVRNEDDYRGDAEITAVRGAIGKK